MLKKLYFLLAFLAFQNISYAAGHNGHDDPFPFNPPKTMTLLPGLGNYYHPTSTKNPEAQKFFDQGLTLVYGFNHEAAYWSFQRAAQLDPDFAMAYWGMANISYSYALRVNFVILMANTEMKLALFLSVE